MSERTREGLLVIGIGNAYRADDGIGPLVAARVERLSLSGVRVVARSGDALALIEDWSDAKAVILIDAASSGAPPGTIHRLDLTAGELPRELSLSSTHALGIAQAIGLARAIGRLPQQLIVYAIAGTCFEAGQQMTAPVRAIAGQAVERVVCDLRSQCGMTSERC